MSKTRIERRKNIEQQQRIIKRRRKKSPFKIAMIVLTLFLVVIGYGIYDYYNAIKDIENKHKPVSGETTKDNEEDMFNGVKDLDKINVLILGVDSKDAQSGRTDTIMVAQYEPKTGRAKIASIMRDSYVSIPGYQDNKINSAYFLGGAELVRQTIKENFDIDVEYYAIVDFDGFAEVMDVLAPDGVEIDVEKRMYYTDRAGGLYIDFQPGLQKLNGEQLLEYARFRHDAESDFGRVRRQQQVIAAVKDEIISLNGITKLPKMLGTVQPFIDTNMGSKTILGIGASYLMNPKELETIRIPVDGSFENGSYSHAGSVLEIDREVNKQALADFFNPTIQVADANGDVSSNDSDRDMDTDADSRQN